MIGVIIKNVSEKGNQRIGLKNLVDVFFVKSLRIKIKDLGFKFRFPFILSQC